MSVHARDYLVGTPAPVDGRTFGAVFAAAVAAGGPGPAIVAGGEAVPWERWSQDAEALALGLQESGLGPGDVVGVQLANSRAYLTVHVALGLTGAVMLPLHMAIGPADVAALMQRSGALALVCSPREGYLRIRDSCPDLRYVFLAPGDGGDGVFEDAAEAGPGVASVSGLIARWSGHGRRPSDTAGRSVPAVGVIRHDVEPTEDLHAQPSRPLGQRRSRGGRGRDRAGGHPRVCQPADTHVRPVLLADAGVTRLSAMGGYLRLFDGWIPPQIATPTLFVRAGIPLAAGLRPAQWQLPHGLVTVDSDHLDLLTMHAATTASAIEHWLTETISLAHQGNALPALGA